MKTIIFFDLDGTINNKNKQSISNNTIKLLKSLYNKKDVELGIATGRSPNNIEILDEIAHLFKYKIFINGALAYKNDKLVYENSIKKEELIQIYEKINENNIMTGFILENIEYVVNLKENVSGINYSKIKSLPMMSKEILKNNNIYQIWMFDILEEEVKKILKDTKLNKYSWHKSGFDIVDSKTNKAAAIKAMLKDYKYKLIAIGDGENDIEMIKLADVGIVMENSKFDELKKEATYIAPHIDKDKLYEFFKEIKLIS